VPPGHAEFVAVVGAGKVLAGEVQVRVAYQSGQVVAGLIPRGAPLTPAVQLIYCNNIIKNISILPGGENEPHTHTIPAQSVTQLPGPCDA